MSLNDFDPKIAAISYHLFLVAVQTIFVLIYLWIELETCTSSNQTLYKHEKFKFHCRYLQMIKSQFYSINHASKTVIFFP